MPTDHEKITGILKRMSANILKTADGPNLGGRRKTLQDMGVTLDRVATDWQKVPTRLTYTPRVGAAEKDEYPTWAKQLLDGLPQLEAGIADAVNAFRTGDPIGETESILNICSTLVATFGPLLGPEAAPLVTMVEGLVQLAALIVGLFEPKAPSLLDQIETLLQKEQAKDQLRQLKTALMDFASIEAAWADGLWVEIDLQHGPEVTNLRTADGWLQQLLPKWAEVPADEQLWGLWLDVLDVQCDVFIEAVRALPLALVALCRYNGLRPAQQKNAGGLLRAGLGYMKRRQLEFLRTVAPALQNRGVYIVTGDDGGFRRNDRMVPATQWSPLGEWNKRIAMYVSPLERANPSPHVNLYGLGRQGDIWGGVYGYGRGNLDSWTQLGMDKGRTVIWAVWRGDGVPVVYTTDGRYIHGFNGYHPEQTWQSAEIHPTAIRAVQNPKSVADDPDENTALPRVLDGVDVVLYGAIAKQNRLSVHAWTPQGAMAADGTVPGPKELEGKEIQTIGVERCFLWVLAGREHAWVATHTSVVKAARAKAAPTWLRVKPALPGGLTFEGADEFFPCDDNTVYTITGKQMNHFAWSADLKTGKVRMGGSQAPSKDPVLQLLKFPMPRWPKIGAMIGSMGELFR